MVLRFYFDFIDGGYATHDLDGHDLDGPDAVRAEIARALPEVLLSSAGDGADRQVACEVRDGHGTVVCRGLVTLAIQMMPNL